MKRERVPNEETFLMQETKSTLAPMHKKPPKRHWGDSISFHQERKSVGGIRRENKISLHLDFYSWILCMISTIGAALMAVLMVYL